MKPYTYYVYHIPTKSHYYGVRFSKICHPDDLWVTYFTSCKEVKKLIKKYGKDSFIVQVRKIFDDKQKAILWEEKVLRRMKVLQKNEWINKNISGAIVYKIHPRGMKGKKHSEETIKKLKNSLKGKTYEEIYGEEKAKRLKDNRSKTHLGKSKKYLEGKTYEEIYGEEKAKQLREKRSKSAKGRKHLTFKKPKKVRCDHCNNMYDPGNYKQHINRLAKKGQIF